MKINVDKFIRRYEDLVSERETFDKIWSDISNYVYPDSSCFESHSDLSNSRKVYDSTAIHALDYFARFMDGLMTPSQNKWHTLRASDEKLNNLSEVKDYLKLVCDRLFNIRYKSNSGFGSAIFESYKNLGAYGTQIINTEDNKNGGINYRSMHLSECYIDTNHLDQVTSLFWKRKVLIRNIKEKYGEDALPEYMLKQLKEDTNAYCETVTYFGENQDGLASSHYKYMACHIDLSTNSILGVGGYYDFPFHVSRFSASCREKYGYSPAMSSLADIKVLNDMSRATLRAAEKVTDPPLAIADEGINVRPNLNPGAINAGAIDSSGRLMIQPIMTNANHTANMIMIEKKQKAIRESFWLDLFQEMQADRNMTATEVLTRVNERSNLMSPIIARQERELFTSLVKREIGILKRNGLLPNPPDPLQDLDIDVEYTSPMSTLRSIGEVSSLLKSLNIAREMSSYAPNILDNFDSDEIIRGICKTYGISQEYLRAREEVNHIRNNKNNAQRG